MGRAFMHQNEFLILQQWSAKDKIVALVQTKTAEMCFVVMPNKQRHDGSVVQVLQHNIYGIPSEFAENTELLRRFLADTYVKVITLADGSLKLDFNHRIKGGGNTIDPVNESQKLWPGGVVPYEIDTTMYPLGQKARTMVIEAINKWNNAGTGFKLEPRIEQTDYVVFGNESNTCYSDVGRQGGRQYVRCDLGNRFDETSILHEIGHAIGFYHEQQRTDRDQHVMVTSKDKTNYGIAGTPHRQYDFTSIMHYPFINKQMDAIAEIPCKDKVGGFGNLSEGDIEAAKYLRGYCPPLSASTPPISPLQIAPSKAQPSSGPKFFHSVGTPIKHFVSTQNSDEVFPLWKVLKFQGERSFNEHAYYEASKYFATVLNEYKQTLLENNYNSVVAELYCYQGACLYKCRDSQKDNLKESVYCFSWALKIDSSIDESFSEIHQKALQKLKKQEILQQEQEDEEDEEDENNDGYCICAAFSGRKKYS
jgi:hypothetical protein